MPVSVLAFLAYRVMRPSSRRMAIGFLSAIASLRFQFCRGYTMNTGWNQKPPELNTVLNIFCGSHLKDVGGGVVVVADLDWQP